MKHLRTFTTMMALCITVSLLMPTTASAENQKECIGQPTSTQLQDTSSLADGQINNYIKENVEKASQNSFLETLSPTEVGIISMIPEERRYNAFEKLLNAHERIRKDELRITLQHQRTKHQRETLNSFLPNKIGGGIFVLLVLLIVFGSLPIATIIIISIWQRNKTRRRKQREDVLVQLAQAGQTITPEIIRSLGINESPYVDNTYITKNEVPGSHTIQKPEQSDSNINSDSPKSETGQKSEKSSTREYIAYNTAKKQTIDYCIKKGSTGLILCIISIIIGGLYPLNLVALIASCIFFVQGISQFLKYYFNRDSYMEEHEISQEPDPSTKENKETPMPNA